jgi:DNA-binding response OmpR family regulator
MTTLSGKRVLVVEDEAMIAAMVEEMLAELGAVVVGPAGTIERGLSLATDEQLDAALLDVNIRSARVDPVAAVLFSRGVPVVFATGYGQSAVNGSRRGPILEKPYTQEKLASALNEALRNHGSQTDVGAGR